MSLFCTVSMIPRRRSGMSSTTMSTMLGFEPALTGAALTARGRRPVVLKATPAAAPILRASLRVIGVSIRHLLCTTRLSSSLGVYGQELLLDAAGNLQFPLDAFAFLGCGDPSSASTVSTSLCRVSSIMHASRAPALR